ncbi:mucin-5AC-like [Rhea pennata]|uniref:mucin-5AC-like n=1 Tax=Rhea pennata TaxID=8795 RepID=UPI002E2645EA
MDAQIASSNLKNKADKEIRDNRPDLCRSSAELLDSFNGIDRSQPESLVPAYSFQAELKVTFQYWHKPILSQVMGAQSQSQQETGNNYPELVQQEQTTSSNNSSKVNVIPPMLTNPIVTPSNLAHNGRVCSTWGNFHFKTFDGDIFHFPGLCNYVFASHCNAAYEDFNIQIRRTVVGNSPEISHITMKLEGVAVELTKESVTINSNRVQLPYSRSGITIERSNVYMKVISKIGIVLMWNEDDSILLELNEKYANQTCGLCGDFNGIPIYNEFYSNNIKMTALQFGNMQKIDGPTENCEDPTSSLPNNCTENFGNICQKTLTSSAFAECNDLVDVTKYIMACQEDLCRSEVSKNSSCICDTFAEYSRQCAHAGGEPLNWRTSKLCPKTCPHNMQYQECGSPCTDTCTNLERSQFCEEHCMDGCFCPTGTVFDDINNSGCIPLQQCHCIYNGNTYAPGTSFSAHCHSCTCNGGQWSCQDLPCSGICSVEGGSHISSYDKKHYNVHGDCTYVLSKLCEDDLFTILAEIRKCGLTDTETCLKTVALSMNKGQTLIVAKADGGVFVNSIYTQLPFSAANVTIFRPSSFFIVLHTNFGLQLEIQITPIMQVFVRLDPIFKDQTCGLCGNFNDVQTDDFKAITGVVEGTAAAFANTWKTQASCPNIQNSFENPCALSIENEKYAQYWCGLLTNSKGPFADCHYAVNPSIYHTNCMFDTCNCEKSEDCLCAALSSYVRACAAKGIQLSGWRTDVCSKYTSLCPRSLNYSYTIHSCQPTCRSLSEPDVTCSIKFVPVDGCTCINGTYMDDSGKCVPANTCPCYYRGSPIPSGEVVHENGLVCTCIQGKLNCIGAPNTVCEYPMVYFDCRNITAGTTGAECQKSCHTLDMQCYSTQCVSGCVCPAGLVLDGKGGCIPEDECPCIHNEAMYQPGEKIKVDCNTCVCKNRLWECTNNPCMGTCAVYGDGHYITFDDKRFSFNGNCEYTLIQNHCGKNGTVNGTFRVITENIPCGNTGTTCSKSIKVFLESYELILGEENVSVVKRGQKGQVPFTVRYMGMYLVIETTGGLILMWDKKTSIFIKLSPVFKGQICGLCGNYDGNGINDFTTRSQSVVENVLEFANSWKVSSICPDADCIKDPCSTNPYRKSWSEKQCSIINSNIFAACHSQVEPGKYYQACVTDACACDTGGDCDCFCTAVAAYAQACSEVGVCIAWRTPSICPLFCDYYNQQGECEWHYKPCGASCMKTCRNPSGKCLHNVTGLEGCYPNCPPDKPYFHEDQMTCVSLCDCYDNEDGKIYRRDECQLCECTSEGLHCKFDDKACHCIYEENSYKYGELIYNTTDGTGWCFSATCDVNGTINRSMFRCGISTTIPFTFSTSQPTSTTAGIITTTPVTTVCVKKICTWSEWYDSTQPENGEDSGDYETFENLRYKGYSVCKNPSSVECRAKESPDILLQNLNQTVTCSQSTGLICNNKDQKNQHCYNYEIRVSCCSYIPCSEIQTTTLGKTTAIKTTTAAESTPFTQTIVTLQTKIKPTANTHTEAQKTEVPSTTPEERESTTSLPQTSARSATSHVPMTSSQPKTYPPESTTSAPETPASTTTASTLPTSKWTTTEGTTVIQKTSATPTEEGTTTTKSTPRATTTPASTALTSRTSPPPTEGTTATKSTPRATTSTPASTALTSRTSPLPTAGTTTIKPSPTTPISTTTSGTSPPATEITTTSSPITTVPTSPTSTATTSSTSCQPRCAWTQWFDVDSPSSGSEGGDMETFENIRAAGFQVCAKPKDIECQAENYPDTSLENLGQKIQCSLDVGLVCRNEDQISKYPMCFNYQVRLYCCDQQHCETTVAPPGTTTRSPATPSPTETSTLTTETPASTTTASTLPTSKWTTTEGTTVIQKTSATPTEEGTTTTKSTPRATTTPASTALTSRTSPLPTTEGTTTTKSTPRATTSTPASTTVTSRTSPLPTAGTTTIKPSPTTPISTTTSGTSPPATEITTTSSPITTVPTSPTSTATTSSTSCQPRCAWTQWFDVDSPSSGSEGGDMETFENIRAAGFQVCAKPKDIECQAENYPDTSLENLGQKIQCSLDVGLVCRNEDQISKYPMCFNYQVRLYCCDQQHCETTVAPPGTTTRSPATPSPTETSTLTTETPASTTTASTLPTSKWTTTEGTTVIQKTSATPTEGTTTTESTPRSTTTSTITSTPRATTTPASTALTSRTSPPPTEGTTTTKSTPRATTTTPASTTVTSRTSPLPTAGTTTIKPSPTTPISTTTSGTSPPATEITTTSSPITTVPTSPTSTATTSSTSCQPRCAWTQWFDVDSPSSGSEGGDMETFENIRAAGFQVCAKPKDIECQAENYPDTSLENLGQKIQCSLDVGLVCRNEDQISKYPMCFNYQVRLYCCDQQHCETTVAPPGTTTRSPATPSPTETSTLTTETPASTTTASTLPTSKWTTTEGTTVIQKTSATPTEEGTTTTKSTPRATTTPASTALTSRTSPPPTEGTTATKSTPRATTSTPASTTVTSRTSPLPTAGTTTIKPSPTTPISTTTSGTSPPATEITTTSSPITTVPTSPTSTATTSSTSCQPRCAWTQWFDVDSPSSGSEGGDMETFENIRAAGFQVCAKPKDIECQAENYPDTSLENLGQKIQCSLDVGLVCRNEDQISKYPMCFNYQVRLYCCDQQHCETTVAPPGTTTRSPATPSPTETSTLTTETPASTTTASTLPTSKWTTTEGTTVIQKTSATPTEEGTTTTKSTPRATTTPASTALTSRTSPPPTEGTTATKSTPRATTTTPASTALTSRTSPLPTAGTTTIKPSPTTPISTTTSGTSPPATEITTTSSPITTVPTSPTSTATTSSTSCQPRCAWTQWFDVDSPSSGSEGGDMETFENIRAAGFQVCAKPKDIECQAENYPDTSLENLGQKIQCSLDVGLVCRNEDQISKYPMCFNYQVRLYCCDQQHCETTVAPPGTTTRSPATPSPTETSTLTTETPASTTTASTLPTSKWTTTEGTTVIQKTSATPTEEGTTTTKSTPRATTSTPASTTVTSRTSPLPTAGTTTIKPSPTTPISTTTSGTSPPATEITTTSSPITTVPTSPTSTATTSSTSCQPRCAWTQWFDVDSPSSGSEGGDMETFENIRAAGFQVCAKPKDIECQAENYPDTSLENLGQKIQCSLDVGLVCRNEDQISKYPMCFNYQVRLYCCDQQHCETTVAPPGTTTRSPATPSPTETSTLTTETPASTTTASTLPTSKWTTTEGTTVIQKTSATPTEEGTTTTKSTPRATTTPASTALTSRTSPPPTEGTTATKSTPRATTTTPASTALTSRTSPLPTAGTTTIKPSPTTPISTTTSGTSPPATEITTTSSPITTVPTSPTSTATTSSTSCQPRCAWTQWFDVDSPSSGSEGGDMETFENIRAAGFQVCAKPKDIECQAENYPDTSLENLGQKIQCSLDVGLVCRNEDQISKYPMCFNYQVRLYCCDQQHCETTVAPPGTTTRSPATPSPTETSTLTTETPASTTTASTLPTSKWTTTEGTTVIQKTSATPTEEGTTTTKSTPRATTTPASTALTSRTSPPPTEGTTATKSTPRATTSTPASTTVTSRTSPLPTAGTTTIKPSPTTPISTTTSGTSPPATEITTTSSPITTVPTSPTSTATTSSTSCQPRCAWTQWFDVDSPSSGSEGGDMETFENIRAAGFQVCAKPKDIECQAENYPDTSLENLGQKIQCSLDVGLVCRNEDQISKYPMCFNYQVRLYCCDQQHCETTVAPPGTTTRSPATPSPTETSTLTTETPASTTTASTLPTSKWTTTEGTTVIQKTSATPTEEGTTTTKSTPRATTTPASTALTSRTSPPPTEGTTATKSTPRATTTTPASTALTSRTSPLPTAGTTTIKPSPTTPISTTTSGTSPPATEITTTSSPITTVPTSPTSTATTSSTSCQPRCAWTQWFDVDSPSSGSEGGDMETFENIRAAGFQVCAKPKDIECQAENYPDTSLENLGQKIQCSLDVGLVCRNEDQISKYPMCFNYQVRLYCCDQQHCETTVAPPGTTTRSPATPSPTETSTLTTETPASTTTASTLPTSKWTTTEGTTVIQKTSATPTEEGTTTTKSTPRATTTPASTALTSRTSPPPTEGTTATKSTPRATTSTPASTALTSRTSPLPTAGTTTIKPSPTTPISTTTSGTSPPATEITTTSSPITTVPTSPTSTATTSSTSCQPRCAWTQWFDVDSPSSGSEGGDMETFENIRAAGFQVCAKPKDIECQAENYPDTSLENLGQKIQCSLDVGLVCRNEDQISKYPMCFNYQVRLYCCDQQHCETTVAPPGTTTRSPATPSPTETSTLTTETPASTTTASTLPTSKWTTTEGTTVIQKTSATPTEEGTTTTKSTPRATTTPASTALTSRTSPPPTEGTTATKSTPRATTSTPASTTVTSRTSPLPTAGTTTIKPSPTTPISTTTSGTSPPATEITTTSSPITTVPTSPTSTATTSSTSCQPRCAWTQWFDVDSPSSGSEGGDMETFENIRAAGFQVCAKPKDIECQAENYPDTSLENLGQKIQCSLDVGLVCRNEDQISKYPMCFNYQVRLYCCDQQHCETTVAPPGTTTRSPATPSPTETSTLTTETPASTTTASTLPTSKWTTTEGTTVIQKTSATPTEEGTTTTKSTPRATTTPASTALTSRTSPPPTEGTTATKSTPRATTTTPASTALTSRTSPLPTAGTTTIKPSPTTPISTTTSGTSPPATEITTTSSPITTVPTSPTSTATTSSTSCQPRCAWTQWFDVDSPSSGSEGGDMETFENIRAAGFQVCAKPKDIECQAENYPDTSLENLGQKIQCSLDVGLVCRNEDQISKYPMCFNYQVRLYCCDQQHCETTVAPPGTTTRSPATPSPTETSTLTTETPASTTTASTLPTSKWTTTEGTTVIQKTSATPTEEGTTTTKSTPRATTTPASTALTSRTSPPPTEGTTATKSTPRATTTTPASTTVTSRTSPLPTAGTTIIKPSPTTPISTTTSGTSPPATEITTTSSPITTVPTSPTSTATTSSTSCQPRCAWTQWFDVDSPSSGSEGGDMETFENIRAAGFQVCAKPKDIECQAENYPDTSLENLGQKIQCSLDVGLVCRNEDQISKYPMCFNYQVRLYCCDQQHCETTVAPPGTTTRSPATPSPTETSTLTTETPASTTTASTLPTSKWTTTEGTTVIQKTSATPTEGTTTTKSTPRATTTPTSTALTSRTSPPPTEGTTTTKSTPRATTSTPASTTVTSRTSPLPTAGTTTIKPSPTTPISTTTSGTSPPATEITTTSSPITTVPTSPTSTATTSSRSIAPATGTPQSTHLTTSTLATFTSSFSTPFTTESAYVTSSQTTQCFCHVFGDLFSPGEVVYNRTDSAGCNFYGLCNTKCEVDAFQGLCPSTAPFTSATAGTATQASSSALPVFSSASPITATSLTTSVERNCTDVNPPRKPGEKWKSACQECVCDPLTVTVQCQPPPCQTNELPVCPEGFFAMSVLPKDPCCPEFKCEMIPGTCVVNHTVYMVGMSMVIDSCKNCTCTSEKDPVSNNNILQCEPVHCETSCPLGYEYKLEDGECCGKCVEAACRIRLSNNTVQVLSLDEILPLDLCSYYKCEKIEDQFVAVQTKKTCPEFKPGECDLDEAETTPDGCCKICKPPNCKAYSKKTVIRHGECESSQPVELGYCEGTCPGSSVYSIEANQMQHDCSCCQELKSQTREVTLTCQNGTSISYNYVYVEQCQCMNACISEAPGTGVSQWKKSSGRKR